MHNTDAESATLGCLLLDNTTYHDIGDLISWETFNEPDNQKIMKAITQLQRQHDEFDLFTVAEHLEKTHSGDWTSKLTTMVAGVSNPKNARTYARMVLDNHTEHELLAKALQIHSIAKQADLPMQERIAQAQSLMLEIDGAGTDNPTDMPHHLKAWHELLVQRENTQGTVTGLPTGFDAIDARLSGLHPGRFYVFAARPGMGKTNLMLNMMANQLHANPLVFSLEMPADELIDRVAANMADTPYSSIMQGNLNQEQYSRITELTGKLHESGLHIDARAGQQITDIIATARRCKARYNTGVIFVDYLQLIRTRAKSETESITIISQELKKLSKDLSVPVVALAQLNRECEKREDKRPMMSDLRQSGSIEQDADAIGFIFREEVYNPNTQNKGLAELIFRKIRQGQPGTTYLETNFGFCKFANTNREPAQEVEIKPFSKMPNF